MLTQYLFVIKLVNLNWVSQNVNWAIAKLAKGRLFGTKCSLFSTKTKKITAGTAQGETIALDWNQINDLDLYSTNSLHV